MDRLLQDLHAAGRSLRRAPVFTAVAVLTLALGIGLDSALFTVVNAVLLRPLPFPDAERLVVLYSALPDRGFDDVNLSYPDFVDWTEQTDVLEEAAVYTPGHRVLTGIDEPVRLRTGRITPAFFRVFGLEPVVGRAFAPGELVPGQDDVVVLGEGLWRRAFGSDPGIVGAPVILDGRPRTVVGVVPEVAVLPGVEAWLPLARTAEVATRSNRFLQGYGRLREGVSSTGAEARLDLVAARLAAAHPDTNEGWEAAVGGLHEATVGEVRQPMTTLLAIVGVVLLIACANVANLLMARASDRRRELAVRAALGADRRRLVGQLLTESLVLATGAGVVGLALSLAVTRLVVAVLPPDAPRLQEIGPDLWVVGFTFAVALATGLLFGTVPALRASRPDLESSLRRAGAGGRDGRLAPRNVLVVAEVAVATVLLAGAGLLLSSLLRLQAVDPGFDAGNVLVLPLDPSASGDAAAADPLGFQESLIDAMEELEGVAAAGVVHEPPVVGSSVFRLVIRQGEPVPELDDAEFTHTHWVSPGYFETLGIRRLRGRDFTRRDDAAAPPVAILGATLARRLFGEEDPLGRQVRAAGDEEFPRTVVGVVADVRRRLWQSEPLQQVYVPTAQDPRQRVSLLVRTRDDPASMVGVIRERLLATDPDLPVREIALLRERVAGELSGQESTAFLVGAFAAVALGLTLVGLYGVVSTAASRRVREIGVRVALGADRRAVTSLVVRHGVGLAALGAALGLGAALAGGRLVAGLLYDVTPADPTILAAAVLLPLVAAAGASWLPARRAARVDPIEALRAP